MSGSDDYRVGFNKRLAQKHVRLLDSFRIFSSTFTGLTAGFGSPLISSIGGVTWAFSTLLQASSARSSESKPFNDYFSLTLARDFFCLASGATFGYGVALQGDVSKENVLIFSLPAYTAGVTHFTSRSDLKTLEDSL
ncbi:MAG: hypothetical protein AABW73_01805 [Nanoarchaeota archaeon]